MNDDTIRNVYRQWENEHFPKLPHYIGEVITAYDHRTEAIKHIEEFVERRDHGKLKLTRALQT